MHGPQPGAETSLDLPAGQGQGRHLREAAQHRVIHLNAQAGFLWHAHRTVGLKLKGRGQQVAR